MLVRRMVDAIAGERTGKQEAPRGAWLGVDVERRNDGGATANPEQTVDLGGADRAAKSRTRSLLQADWLQEGAKVELISSRTGGQPGLGQSCSICNQRQERLMQERTLHCQGFLQANLQSPNFQISSGGRFSLQASCMSRPSRAPAVRSFHLRPFVREDRGILAGRVAASVPAGSREGYEPAQPTSPVPRLTLPR